MKYLTLLLLLFSSSALSIASPQERTVKVHVVSQAYDIQSPWNRGSSKDGSGSGLVYKSGLVLTNAHVVRHARQVYIQPYQSSLKIEAEVLFYAPGIDLAILKPLDDSLTEFDPIEINTVIPNIAEMP